MRVNTILASRPVRLVAIGVTGSAIAVGIGNGVFAPLNATAANSSPQSASSGVLSLTMSPGGNNTAGFTQEVSNLAPGDVVNRYVDLLNPGTLDGTLTHLKIDSTGSANLISDNGTTKAITIAVTNCSVAWSAAGSCSGTATSEVGASTLSSYSTGSGLAFAPAIDLTAASGTTAHLQISLALPDQAETTANGTLPASTIQGASANLTYTFLSAQRNAITENS